MFDGKLRPHPGRTHEFLLVANFAEGHDADLCVLSLSHLNLKSQVERLPNGRANAEFRIIAMAESDEFKSAKEAVSNTAIRHGGKLVSCLVLMRPSTEGADAC